jgi:hypothetical protein
MIGGDRNDRHSQAPLLFPMLFPLYSEPVAAITDGCARALEIAQRAQATAAQCIERNGLYNLLNVCGSVQDAFQQAGRNTPRGRGRDRRRTIVPPKAGRFEGCIRARSADSSV